MYINAIETLVNGMITKNNNNLMMSPVSGDYDCVTERCLEQVFIVMLSLLAISTTLSMQPTISRCLKHIATHQELDEIDPQCKVRRLLMAFVSNGTARDSNPYASVRELCMLPTAPA